MRLLWWFMGFFVLPFAAVFDLLDLLFQKPEDRLHAASSYFDGFSR